MEKGTGIVRITFAVILSSLLFISANAQKKEKMPIWEVRKGCLSFQGNLAPGYLFFQKDVTAYVNGDVECFVDDRTAVFGSLWASFNMGNDPKGLFANHALFTGINYHFLKPQRIDPYIGLTPGIGLVRAGYSDSLGNLHKTDFTPIPLIAVAAGFNYYIGSVFHLFVKAQFTAGQIFSSLPVEKHVDELKITAGLGYNFRAWRPKARDKWKGKTDK